MQPYELYPPGKPRPGLHTTEDQALKSLEITERFYESVYKESLVVESIRLRRDIHVADRPLFRNPNDLARCNKLIAKLDARIATIPHERFLADNA